EAWIDPVVDYQHKRYRFVIKIGTPPKEHAPHNGTAFIDALGKKTKATFRCLYSDTPIRGHYIDDEAAAGRLGTQMLAVVAEGNRERVYLVPHIDYQCSPSLKADERVHEMRRQKELLDQECRGTFASNAQGRRYGFTKYRDYYTSRQLVFLATICGMIRELRDKVREDADKAGRASNSLSRFSQSNIAAAYADAIASYAACGLSKLSETSSTLCTWSSAPKNELVVSTFRRQSVSMTWDYAEANPFGSSSGSIANAFEYVSKCIDVLPATGVGKVRQLDSTAAMEDVASPVICTDPPYYSNIGYADLSDYFYVWLRQSLGSVYPSLFATVLTPKSRELIASPYRHDEDAEKAKQFFESGLSAAFSRMRQIAGGSDYPLAVYYAFRQAESGDATEDGRNDERSGIPVSTGWGTMLSGLISSGYSIHGTWPMRTERGARSVGIRANALASSIVLVCRPRSSDAQTSTRKDFISALRRELPEALRNLQRGSIAPVDLAQAAIGPGMAVFTRYTRVMESDGSPMSVRTALGLINQTLDEVLAEQEGEFDTDTRWALAWFEQFGMDEGPFGVAETLSKAKNTAVNGLVDAGIARARGGKVQLLNREELPEHWEPSKDKRLTIWEVTQYLIRTLDQKGESEAAALLHKLGGLGETARDLAYRLYTICERKKWADEALAYNGLVIAWPELTKLAQAQRSKSPATQTKMFE
ncbi:MAG: hypothetical protein KJZ78_23885, partial [Bryobacteraceae bacterium]|nr:hypothetical protein [Bryobacteraceae bacterium]